ncbi:hypothetical protein BDZ85DRAFT_268439 [Elsinoe ampelina]|uniref:Uncharacterized protein n=1 Tax=Elsinoe ampelina TaxID=302913 RepID=A0A6A6G124_9PEZI|nr:hypothetical protein BDZ85DRAFT_268439 [Elsinoe ampelina]
MSQVLDPTPLYNNAINFANALFFPSSLTCPFAFFATFVVHAAAVLLVLCLQYLPLVTPNFLSPHEILGCLLLVSLKAMSPK